MAGETIKLEIITPERVIFSQEVTNVVVPGELGDFSALPGHAPFISLLRAGVVVVFNETTVFEKIFVSGGFAEITPSHCAILATQAVNVEQINRAQLEKQISRLQEDQKLETKPEQQVFYEKQLIVMQAQIDALEPNVYG